MYSMRTAIVGGMAALAVWSLAACGRIEPLEDGVPPHVTRVENAFAEFSVEPGVVSECEGNSRVASRVAWKVKDPAVHSVEVQVGEREGTRKVFAAGAAQGESVTGNWVVGGTRFYLVDRQTRRELAYYQVAGSSCR